MNQKGETTLLAVLLMMSLMGVIILTSLELKKSYLDLERRTQLFLCVKESKGELKELLVFMGKANWGIKNIDRIKLIIAFFPGLQGYAMNAQKIKKYLQQTQDIRLKIHLAKLKNLRNKKCPIDPKMLFTPFKLQYTSLYRDTNGLVTLRKEEWSHLYLKKNYLIELTIKPWDWENLHPKISFQSKEKKVKVSSLWFSS